MGACRLCGAATSQQFQLKVLAKYTVTYARCEGCGSLQTDEPFWLEEAYASSLAAIDVGAAQRALTNQAVVWTFSRLLGLSHGRILDYGGGSGLLCRLLRDIGIDAWTYDRHSGGEYAGLFRYERIAHGLPSPDLVTSFEVLEHLPHPAKDLGELFQLRPRLLLASTETYNSNSDSSWPYLVPETGQHVFFYTGQALAFIAKKYGYHYFNAGMWHCFSQVPIPVWKRMVMKGLVRGPVLRMLRILVLCLPTRKSVEGDFQRGVVDLSAGEGEAAGGPNQP